jgi:hypothetical protein
MQPPCCLIPLSMMKDKLVSILGRLQNSQADLSRKQVVAGFDGFIDSIQKVVLNQAEDHSPEYFKTIEEFGRYIAAKQSGGLSLETEEIAKKIGGNVPILTNAAARFGVIAHAIGAFGYPNTDPVFSSMPANTYLHSFADPGMTSALEFQDGKLMLAQMSALNAATWELIKKYIGLKQIIEIFDNGDMFCLLNWSEVRHTNDIWEGILREVFPSINWKFRKKVLFDLADCSKHGSQKIMAALELIQRFNLYCDITLSLNRNEAILVHQALNQPTSTDLDFVGSGIYKLLDIDTLVIHTSTRSMGWRKSEIHRADTFLIKDPQVSTGAGDNFNAGLCIGQLIGLATDELLLFANMVAACYMINGESPGIKELHTFISGSSSIDHSSNDRACGN